jgi:hypothetical protein
MPPAQNVTVVEQRFQEDSSWKSPVYEEQLLPALLEDLESAAD